MHYLPRALLELENLSVTNCARSRTLDEKIDQQSLIKFKQTYAVLLSRRNDYLLEKNMALKHEDCPMTQVQQPTFPPPLEVLSHIQQKKRFPVSLVKADSL